MGKENIVINYKEIEHIIIFPVYQRMDKKAEVKVAEIMVSTPDIIRSVEQDLDPSIDPFNTVKISEKILLKIKKDVALKDEIINRVKKEKETLENIKFYNFGKVYEIIEAAYNLSYGKDLEYTKLIANELDISVEDPAD